MAQLEPPIVTEYRRTPHWIVEVLKPKGQFQVSSKGLLKAKFWDVEAFSLVKDLTLMVQ